MRIWFMPTGWRPADVLDKFPLAIIDDPLSKVKYSPMNSNAKLIITWIQFSLAGIFMFLIFYSMEGLSQAVIIISVGLLLMHIMSYTFLLDNNKLAILLEILKFITGILLLYLVNKNGRLTSDLIQIMIYSYYQCY